MRRFILLLAALTLSISAADDLDIKDPKWYEGLTIEEVNSLSKSTAGMKALKRMFKLYRAQHQTERICKESFIFQLSAQMMLMLEKRSSGTTEIVSKDDALKLGELVGNTRAWERAGLIPTDPEKLLENNRFFARFDDDEKIYAMEVWTAGMEASLKMQIIESMMKNTDVSISKIISFVERHAKNPKLKTTDGWKTIRDE